MKSKAYFKARITLKYLIKTRVAITNEVMEYSAHAAIYKNPWYRFIRHIKDQDVYDATDWLENNGYIKRDVHKLGNIYLTQEGLHYFELLQEDKKSIFLKSFALPLIVSIAINTPNWWPWLLKWVSKRP